MKPKFRLEHAQSNTGVHRRDFMKFCGVVATALSLDITFVPKIAEALTSDNRPPVLWLHFAECTGCTESILRTSSPWMDELLFDTISLDYHETLMAAAGHTVEALLTQAADVHKGEFFCVVEGAIPTADNGIYGTIGGRTMLSIAEEILPKARAVIACGTCAAYGGVAAASPNPTGAKGVQDALPNLNVPVVNLPGCPPNPVNFVAVIANYLLNDMLPAMDSLRRPTFAYGRTVHDRCPYEEDSLERFCLENQGCKGPRTRNNCSTIKFNDGTSFPMQVGHPCIGCSEPNFWDTMTPVYRGSVEESEDDYPSGGTGDTPLEGGGGETPPTDGGGETPPTDGGGETPPTDGGGETPPTDGGGETPPTDGGGETPPTDGGDTPTDNPNKGNGRDKNADRGNKKK